MEGKNIEYKRGLWTLEEDRTLMDYIRVHGKGKWNRVSKVTGLKRCGKSCRLRWMNYLSPNVKRGDFSEEEDDLIIRLHNLLGNRWSLIAGRVPGRTDNQVKNHWNTHLSKKLGVSSKRAKTKAPKSTTSTSSLEQVQGSYCTPSSEKPSNSDGQLQQPLPPSSSTSNFSTVNGDYECAAAGFDDEVLMIKDNNVGGVGNFSGMWEAMVGNNNYDISNSSSFWFYNDDLNLYSPCLLDPSLDDHCPLQFEFISNYL